MDVVTKRVFFILSGLIVLGAIAIRFWQLGALPVSLYWDEVALFIDARVVAEHGTDMHGNPWYQVLYPSYGDYKQPVYIWIASALFSLFGASAFILRSVSALFGVFSVIIVGVLAYLLMAGTSKKSQQEAYVYSACSMLVVAFSPWSVLFSRTGFEGFVGQALVGLSVVAVLFITRVKMLRSQLVLVFVAVGLGALATYTYFSVRFVWPVVFILGLGLVAYQEWKNTKGLPKWYLGTGIIGLILYGSLLIPMFNNPYYQASNRFRLSAESILNTTDYALESNILREQAGNALIDRIFFHRHWLLLRTLFKNVSQNLSFDFLFVSGDPNLRHGTGFHGLFVLPLIVPFLIGFARLYQRQKEVLLLLIGWWLIALLPASVPMDVPHALRSLNALLPLSLLIGYGLVDIYHSFFGPIRAKIMSSLLLIAILLYSAHFIYYYFYIYPSTSAFHWQAGYKELAEYVLEHNDEVRTVWVHPFEDRFYLWLLANEKITTEEILAMEKSDFKPNKVENIIFDPFDWEKLESLDHKIMIVGQPDFITGKREGAFLEPYQSQVITDKTGQERFIVDWYQP